MWSRLYLGMGHGKDLLFPNNLKGAEGMTMDVTWNKHWLDCDQLKNLVFFSLVSSLLCPTLVEAFVVSQSVQPFIDWQGERP